MKHNKLALTIILFFAGLIILIIQLKISNTITRQPDEKAEITINPTASPTPTATPSPTLLPTIKPTTIIKADKPSTLDELFAKYGSQYNVDPNVLKKIAGCESGYDTNQVTNDYAGLFQFASFAWTEARGRMGLPADQSLRFNPEESIRTAAFEINYKGTSGWDDCD